MTIHILTHKGTEQFKGSEEGCFFELQRKQSQSAQHAIRYEGWKIEPQEVTQEEGKEILARDRWYPIEVTLMESLFNSNTWVKVQMPDGTTGRANKNAMTYKDTTPGSKVNVKQGYITKD